MKSNLVLGTWQFGGSFGYWEDQEKDKSKAVIKAALRCGITTFDTAYSYLNTETLLSSLLPMDVKIYTKVQPIPSFEKKFKTSLLRLKRDNIDTLFIHWPTDDRPLLDETIKTLFRLKEEGLINNVGYSNFPLSYLKELPYPDKIERATSLLWTQDLRETQEWCKANKVALVGYSPLSMGLLSGKYKRREDLNDKRQNLYIFDHLKEFNTLLTAIEKLAKERECSMSRISLSWAIKQCDEVVFGARDINTLLEDIEPLELKKEELDTLYKASDVIASIASSDNMLSHNWRINDGQNA